MLRLQMTAFGVTPTGKRAKQNTWTQKHRDKKSLINNTLLLRANALTKFLEGSSQETRPEKINLDNESLLDLEKIP